MKNLIQVIFLMVIALTYISCSDKDENDNTNVIDPPVETFTPIIETTSYGYASDMVWCDDSTLVMVGRTWYDKNDSEIRVLKVDLKGELIWDTTINFGGFASGSDIEITDSGDFLVSGGNQAATDNIVLASVSAEGELNWQRTIDYPESYWNEGMLKKSDGTFQLVYNERSTLYHFMTQIDEMGNILHEEVIKNDTLGYIEDARFYNNEDILIHSSRTREGNERSINIYRVSGFGEVRWNLFFDSENQTPHSIRTMSNDNCLILTSSYIDGVSGKHLLTYDGNGAKIDSININALNTLSFDDILVTDNREIYLSTYFYATELGENPILIKLNEDGSTQWEWHLSQEYKSYVYNIEMNESGDIYGLATSNFKLSVCYIPQAKLLER